VAIIKTKRQGKMLPLGLEFYAFREGLRKKVGVAAGGLCRAQR